jgi:hypothetical protein
MKQQSAPPRRAPRAGRRGGRWLLASAAVLLATLAAGCRHNTQRAEAKSGRCPESQNLWCMTEVECSTDRDRGCQVCQCAQGFIGQEEERLPSNLPPDRRPAG